MNQKWVEASQLRRRNNGADAWDVDFDAHPFLDPRFVDHPSRQTRVFWQIYQRSHNDDEGYRCELARQLHPAGTPPQPDDMERLLGYLNEVNAYLSELVHLLPDSARRHAAQLPMITACNDVRTLLSIIFSRQDRRVRYEAQRKLYLARLLMTIDHSRDIQDGPRHKAYFEGLLRDRLMSQVREEHEVSVGFEMGADGETISYNLGHRPGQERWTFNSRFVEVDVRDRTIPLDILYWNCRFKRSVVPATYEIVDGRHQVVERRRWGTMRSSRNGSILSKMIRRSITDPDAISDLLGAMFIVPDEDGLNDLLALLNHVLGTPLGWRNVTDTMAFTADALRLNPDSGSGYKVFKGDLDILHPAIPPGKLPYRFTVEIQIYTLEGFLRTVHGAHAASHLALKLRQFLYGLVPRLFPRAIYGSDWLNLD